MQWEQRLNSGAKAQKKLIKPFFSCECHTQWANSGQLDVLFASITFDKTDYGGTCLKNT